MAPLAACLAHLSALITSSAPPRALFVHTPGDAQHTGRALVDTLKQIAGQPSYPDHGSRPTVDHLLPKVASLDLAQLHSTKAIFDSIIAQLSGWDSVERSKWDDRDKGIPAWDGNLAALRVVRSDSDADNGGANADQRPAKRARTRRADEESFDGATADATSNGGAGTARWSLQWRAGGEDALNKEKAALAPLRNTIEAFHRALRSIITGSSSSASGTRSSAFDAAADFGARGSDDNPDLPAHRYIVIEHGELLGELAGGGAGVSGAARETGVGVTFASTLYRLAEITDLPITTIVFSRLPWHKMRESMVGLPSPELLTIDDMPSAEIVHLLTSRFARSRASHASAQDTLSHEQLVELFRSLAFVVLTTFGRAVTDVDEFAFLCARLWPRWKEVRDKSNPPIAPSDTARLSIALKADFALELERLFLPRPTLAPVWPIAPSLSSDASVGDALSKSAAASAASFSGTIAAPPKRPTYLDSPSSPAGLGDASGSAALSNASAAPDDFFAARAAQAFASPARPPVTASDPFSAALPPALPLPLSRTTSASALGSTAAANAMTASLARSLPLAGRYLLLAAYFAAHNPPKSDVRMFVRVDELEGVAKKGKKARRGGGAKGGRAGASPKKNSAALTGGKSFPLERLVALFDAIVDSRLEYALGTPSVLGLVQTLVQLRLLTRASGQDKVLDGVRLRCAIERDEADGLAVSVGWREWKERLVGED